MLVCALSIISVACLLFSSFYEQRLIAVSGIVDKNSNLHDFLLTSTVGDDSDGGESSMVALLENDAEELKQQNKVLSLNQRLSLRRALPESAVQRYCGDPNDCWEPNDLAGTWVLDDDIIIDDTNSTARKETHNKCPGWNFGQLCEDNGYARNVECPAAGNVLAFVDHYHWEAKGLLPFDATESCRLLGNRTVLMIGDSTMGQTASTLINRLLPAGCQAQVGFQLADTLVKSYLGQETLQEEDASAKSRLAMNRGPHWLKPVQNQQPDIVFFSLGAHIYGEDRWKAAFDNVVDGMVKHKAKVMNETSRTIHFVYKTQSPGGCSRDISTLLPDEAARAFSDYLPEYNHAMFYGRDLYALARLKKLQWPAMDLRMLYARTDSHVSSRFWPGEKMDCLHLCTPGPLDVAADLFQELLMHELHDA